MAQVTFKLSELDELIKNHESGVTLVPKCVRQLILSPYQLQDLKNSIRTYLYSTVAKYDPQLDGIILSYKRIKIEDFFNIQDDGKSKFRYTADIYVFKPRTDSILSGVINKKGTDHLSCLVHRVFNIAIPRPDNLENDESWIGSKLSIGQEVQFKVVDVDLNEDMPYIKGELIEEPGLICDDDIDGSDDGNVSGEIENNSNTFQSNFDNKGEKERCSTNLIRNSPKKHKKQKHDNNYVNDKITEDHNGLNADENYESNKKNTPAKVKTRESESSFSTNMVTPTSGILVKKYEKQSKLISNTLNDMYMMSSKAKRCKEVSASKENDNEEKHKNKNFIQDFHHNEDENVKRLSSKNIDNYLNRNNCDNDQRSRKKENKKKETLCDTHLENVRNLEVSEFTDENCSTLSRLNDLPSSVNNEEIMVKKKKKKKKKRRSSVNEGDVQNENGVNKTVTNENESKFKFKSDSDKSCVNENIDNETNLDKHERNPLMSNEEIIGKKKKKRKRRSSMNEDQIHHKTGDSKIITNENDSNFTSKSESDKKIDIKKNFNDFERNPSAAFDHVNNSLLVDKETDYEDNRKKKKKNKRKLSSADEFNHPNVDQTDGLQQLKQTVSDIFANSLNIKNSELNFKNKDKCKDNSNFNKSKKHDSLVDVKEHFNDSLQNKRIDNDSSEYVSGNSKRKRYSFSDVEPEFEKEKNKNYEENDSQLFKNKVGGSLTDCEYLLKKSKRNKKNKSRSITENDLPSSNSSKFLKAEDNFVLGSVTDSEYITNDCKKKKKEKFKESNFTNGSNFCNNENSKTHFSSVDDDKLGFLTDTECSRKSKKHKSKKRSSDFNVDVIRQNLLARELETYKTADQCLDKSEGNIPNSCEEQVHPVKKSKKQSCDNENNKSHFSFDDDYKLGSLTDTDCLRKSKKHKSKKRCSDFNVDVIRQNLLAGALETYKNADQCLDKSEGNIPNSCEEQDHPVKKTKKPSQGKNKLKNSSDGNNLNSFNENGENTLRISSNKKRKRSYSERSYEHLSDSTHVKKKKKRNSEFDLLRNELKNNQIKAIESNESMQVERVGEDANHNEPNKKKKKKRKKKD